MKIYDIEADLCSHVIQKSGSGFYVRYGCLAKIAKDRIISEIRKVLPEKLTKADLTEKFYADLKILVSVFKTDDTCYKPMVLIEMIDAALVDILQDEIVRLESTLNSAAVLNSNRAKTKVGLLPRFHSVWERSSRLAEYYARPDNYMRNLLLIDDEKLRTMKDKHVFLKKDFFPEFAKSGKLRVAATPLKNAANLNSIYRVIDDVQYYDVDYVHTYNQVYDDMLWGKIVKAGEEGAEILVFPEIMGKPPMAASIAKRLKENAGKVKVPRLIFLPSVWDEGRNYVTVLTGEGELVAEQSKQFPFRYFKDGSYWQEHIRRDRKITIIHAEGIGRIAIIICKDFLTTQYVTQLMQSFKLTMIVVPSFSTGSYDFMKSLELCAKDDCAVVWINTCAAMRFAKRLGKEDNLRHIGYIRKRVAKDGDSAQRLCVFPSCAGAAKGECDKSCLFVETIEAV